MNLIDAKRRADARADIESREEKIGYIKGLRDHRTPTGWRARCARPSSSWKPSATRCGSP